MSARQLLFAASILTPILGGCSRYRPVANSPIANSIGQLAGVSWEYESPGERKLQKSLREEPAAAAQQITKGRPATP